MPRAVWISRRVKYVGRTQESRAVSRYRRHELEDSQATASSSPECFLVVSSAPVRSACQVVTGPYVCGLGRTEVSFLLTLIY